MNLLLTNDDGIEGEGLRALASALIKNGHAVTVVAPDRNNSAVGHKATLHAPLHLADLSGEYGYPAYSLSGTPSDCVMFALGELAVKPQILLSGINEGVNLGSDCMYSGTVGAAQEGAQNRIPSIALSTDYHCTPEDYERVAKIVLEHLDEWYAQAKETGGGLNVNIPAKGEVKGIRFCPTVRHEYNTCYVKNDDGTYSVDLKNGKLRIQGEENGDYPLFKLGYITVTPLTLDMTDRNLLKRWQK